MAVTIMRANPKEATFDKFLRRIGGVADIANSGIGAYSNIKGIQEKNRLAEADKMKAEDDAQGIFSQKELIKDWVDAKEGDPNAQKIKVKGANGFEEKFMRRYEALAKPKSEDEIANTKADTVYKLAQAKKLGSEGNSEMERFKNLPIENQEAVKGLSTKLAGRTSAIAKVDATLKQIEDPNMSEDQKVVAGEQLLKTLNDPDNSDAVGVQEAARLSPYITYQKGNFTGPGKFFGRDMKGFADQLRNTRNRYQESIADSGNIISGLKEGRSLSKLLESQREQKDRDQAGYQNKAENAPIVNARGLAPQMNVIETPKGKFDEATLKAESERRARAKKNGN